MLRGPINIRYSALSKKDGGGIRKKRAGYCWTRRFVAATGL